MPHKPFAPVFAVTAVNSIADRNVTIRNGLINNFLVGINSTSAATIVEDMRFYNNTTGIKISGGGSSTRRNSLHLNALGIDVSGNAATVVDNEITSAAALTVFWDNNQRTRRARGVEPAQPSVEWNKLLRRSRQVSRQSHIECHSAFFRRN
jgi:hypothetical protein